MTSSLSASSRLASLTALALCTAVTVGFAPAAEAAKSAGPAPKAAPSRAEGGSRWGVSGGVAPSSEGMSAFGILPWNGFGLGGRYMLSLPIDSLLPVQARIRDRFALEFGADLLYHSYTYRRYDYRSSRYDYSYSWTQVRPVFAVMWNVWLTDRFVVYPKTELGWGFGWYGGWNDRDYGYDRPVHGGIHVSAGAGVMYKLAGGISLRAELGWSGLKGGVGWLF